MNVRHWGVMVACAVADVGVAGEAPPSDGLGDQLTAIVRMNHRPILAGAADDAVVDELRKLGNTRSELRGLVVVHLKTEAPGEGLDRVLASRGMRCGAVVARTSDGWAVEPHGDCAVPPSPSNVPHTTARVAAPPAHPPIPTSVRVGAGAGVSSLFTAGRVEGVVEPWVRPALGFGVRAYFGLNDGFFGGQQRVYGVEPYATAGTSGRVRVVGQAGLGVGGVHTYNDTTCFLFCDGNHQASGYWEAPRTVATGSAAVGVTARHSGTAVLFRVEANTDGDLAGWLGLQVGAPAKGQTR